MSSYKTEREALTSQLASLENGQRELQILFEKVPCYIAVLDRNFKIVRANEKLRDTFGECRGKHCYEVYKKRVKACEFCPAETSFTDGKEHTSTQVGISKEGKETHYIVTTSPLDKTEDGGSDYIMEILTDITEMKMLEKKKLEAERLGAVGQTVAGLAHTVKNILMGVEGGMYIVGAGIKNKREDRIQEGWEMLQRNIEKVSALVKDFLSFAKGKKPAVVRVNPNAIVDEIIELYEDTAKKLGVNLKRTPSRNISPALLDPDGIHTCLTNLISNAIDTCQASNKPASKVIVDLAEHDGVIKIDVIDNGAGIDYDIQKKIFTTFFTTKGGKGTGLGLLTTRRIIQEHGGKIHVSSEPDKGTTFTIELPRDNLPKD